MEQLLTQFLEHLRYERNLSETHAAQITRATSNSFTITSQPAHPKTGKRSEPALAAIDHITVREWLATLHSAQKQKASIARKLAALRTFFSVSGARRNAGTNPAKLVSTPRLEKKLPKHLSVEEAIKFVEAPRSGNRFGKTRPRHAGVDVRDRVCAWRS